MYVYIQVLCMIDGIHTRRHFKVTHISRRVKKRVGLKKIQAVLLNLFKRVHKRAAVPLAYKAI